MFASFYFKDLHWPVTPLPPHLQRSKNLVYSSQPSGLRVPLTQKFPPSPKPRTSTWQHSALTTGTTIYNTEHYTALFKLPPIISNSQVMTLTNFTMNVEQTSTIGARSKTTIPSNFGLTSHLYC